MHSVIVGGTRGLGRELARLWSREGHSVSVIGRRPPSEADRALGGVHFWTVDVTNGEQLGPVLEEIVTRHGKLDNLVFLQRFKGDGDAWTGEIATSLTATKSMIERLTEHFNGGGNSSIVLVSSIISRFVAEGQPVGYHVVKTAIAQMARFYAVALGPRGIRVNCVSPCTFVKDENREFYHVKAEALHTLFTGTIPLGRMGTALDSANAIAFFCSPQASFLTGQELLVDGGVSLLSQEALARKVAGL